MNYGQNDLNEEYRFGSRVRIQQGNSVNLSVLKDALQEECSSNGIPIAFQYDVLKTGSLFNKKSEDVLTAYNPNHPDDYLRFLIRVTHQGNYAFLDVFKAGNSKNFRNANVAADSEFAPISAFGQKLINKFSGHEEKLQEERDYYTILEDCFQNILR